jgi:hypothetical protein
MNTTESASWEALSHSWRDEVSKEIVDVGELEHRVLKDKRYVRLRLIMELAIAGSGIAIGVWFVEGTRGIDARIGFGTIAFTLLVLAFSMHAHRDVKYETDSVAQMLRSTLAHAERELAFTRAGYFACLAGVLFTAFISLSATQPNGERQRPRAVAAMFFGLAWSGAFAIGLRRRERTLKYEIDRLEHMQSTLC